MGNLCGAGSTPAPDVNEIKAKVEAAQELEEYIAALKEAMLDILDKDENEKFKGKPENVTPEIKAKWIKDAKKQVEDDEGLSLDKTYDEIWGLMSEDIMAPVNEQIDEQIKQAQMNAKAKEKAEEQGQKGSNAAVDAAIDKQVEQIIKEELK
eukprot:GFYU01002043.1.p2 GENE.GFYU01002043.1~~GFYU01002043.1.p2  ORF type:complete len:152 (-),score=84.11 GFYU01002043.1:164-619(-)